MNVKLIFFLTLVLALTLHVSARSRSREAANATVIQPDPDIDAKRVEGEQRFRANCGRCHAAPHKFPPRMMATIVRHMRVRATITDDDMKLILLYMTQ